MADWTQLTADRTNSQQMGLTVLKTKLSTINHFFSIGMCIFSTLRLVPQFLSNLVFYEITVHVSCVTCHMLCVTRHILHITVKCHVIFFLQSGRACRWRVCYQWGLPRLF